ncbi:hypothetical protein NQZ68_032959 [Dissostichus eleginoides]|nr:hypothetical protein NQZ68_032959 [Dissostichus eleginoides]
MIYSLPAACAVRFRLWGGYSSKESCVFLITRVKAARGGVGSAHWELTRRTALRSTVDIGSAVLPAQVMAEDFVKRREEDNSDYLIGTMR